jgi:hypothetical protein
MILKARFKYRADTTLGQKYRERKAIWIFSCCWERSPSS